jgi:SAM-dependent methyltransferase
MVRPPVQDTVDRAWRVIAEIDAALERGEIDEAGWHARVAAFIVPRYLAGDNPRAQSGYSGTEADWRQARSLVSEAILRSGTFLDVGCASGLLMESVRAWCAERGLDVEPFGLDISPELAELARARLPHWRDRIFEGNGLGWIPLRRFDFVRTGCEYVPRRSRRALLSHLLEHAVAPGGRLFIGPFTEERDQTRTEPSLEAELAREGFRARGRIERVHPRDDRVVRRLLYIDVVGASDDGEDDERS